MSCLSFSYKKVDDISLVLDVYGPNVVAKEKAKVPALVYFHGGGLTVGNRNSWFPGWLESQ